MPVHMQQRGQVADIDGALRHVRNCLEVFAIKEHYKIDGLKLIK